MKKTKLITAVLLIMLAACLCSCSSSRRGAAIDSVELYCYTAEGDGFTCGYADEDKTATYRMNIRWHDNDPDRQLEFLELTFLGKFSGDYEGNDHLRYRIFPYRDEYDWDSTGPMVCSVPGPSIPTAAPGTTPRDPEKRQPGSTATEAKACPPSWKSLTSTSRSTTP